VLTRSCCCGVACDCEPGGKPVVASTGYGDFTYTVYFPGSAKNVHVKERHSQFQAIVIDSDVSTGQMVCTDTASGAACGGPVVNIPDAVVLDEDIEIERRDCGYPFTNDTVRNIAYIWGGIPNTCVPSPCLFGGNWRSPGWYNGTLPKTIIGQLTPPRFSLLDFYPGAGSMRFRRTAGVNQSSFDCDITSPPPLPGGVQSINASASRYFHRMGTTEICNALGTGNTTCRSGNGVYSYGYTGSFTEPTIPCQPSSCCCRSELQIRFNVRQYYDVLGYLTSDPNSIGPVSSGSITMGVRAFYYGCIDGRLYDANSTQSATRTFQLDRASIDFPTGYMNFDRYGLGDVPVVPVPLILNSSTSYVDDHLGCLFCSGGLDILTRASAIDIGIPASVEMVRQTP
jgi:hypothetical protein